MAVVEEPKPFVVDSQNNRKPRKKQAPEVSESTPVSPASAPSATILPDHAKVPPVPKRTMHPDEFFRYWASIPEKERDEWFIAYIYRGLPMCDNLQPFSPEDLRLISQGKKKRPDKNQDKVTAPLDPDNWRQQMLDRYGAGDYGIRLNDQHPSVKTTVCFTAIDAESGGKEFRNWDSHPPILNPAEVILTEDANQPYLRWARTHGIKFPGDPGTETGPPDPNEEQEEQDMANAATVVDSVLKQSKDLTDKVLQMANDRSQAAPAPIDAAARAQLGGVETVVEASKQGMKIMGDAFAKLSENQIKAQDPEQQLNSTLNLVKAVAAILPQPAAPSNNGTDAMLAMMKMQMDSQEKNFERILKMQSDAHKESMEMMKSRLDKVEAERIAAPGGKAANELDMLDRLIQYKQKTDEFLESNAPVASGPAWLEPTLNFAEKAMGNIVTGLQTLAALRNAPQPNANGGTPSAVAELPAARAPEESKEIQERRHYAQLIHPHLVAAMKVNTPGHEFAASLIAQVGEQTYNSLAKDGYQGLIDFLRLHQPLYQELMQPPIGAQVLDQFINEFLDRNKVMACVQMLKDGAKPAKHSGPQVAN
jgi:hypothetical protein